MQYGASTRLALAAATIAVCGASAHAQTFPDVNGLDFSVTGVGTINLAFGPVPGIGGSFDYSQTFHLVNGTPPANTSTDTYYGPQSFVVNGDGGSPVENVSGTYFPGSITINGTPNALPAVQLAGTFDRNSGAFNAALSLPNTPTTLSFNETITPTGGSPESVPFTVTANPGASWDFTGQAANVGNELVVNGNGAAGPNVTLTATATVVLPGAAGPSTLDVPVTVNALSIDSFTAVAAVPEPSAIAMLVASAGPALLLRRRRTSR